MPKLTVNREGLLSTPTTLLNLFELDGRHIGLSTVYRFYDGTNNNYQPITFDGLVYTAFPVKVEGLDFDGKGSLPRGTLTVSNIRGFISNLLLQHAQLNRAKFTRTRVYARFIDAVNFDGGINPYGTPDPQACFEAETFYVNRKIREDHDVVAFELVTLLELDDVKLPNRSIYANICPFRFRDPTTCGYAGAPLADRANKLFVGGVGTYGFSSLTDKGEWSAATTYSVGDYVYIVSTLLQTEGDKLYYVCNAPAPIIGEANSPLANSKLWLADACAKNFAGCKLHFSSGPLPAGFFPGVTRGGFQ